MREKALKDGLSLNDFLTQARAVERADQQAKEIENSNAEVCEEQETSVNYVSRNRRRYSSKPERQGRSSVEKKQCYKCGGHFPHENKCPASKARCHFCRKIGHYADMCSGLSCGTDAPPGKYLSIYMLGIMLDPVLIHIEAILSCCWPACCCWAGWTRGHSAIMYLKLLEEGCKIKL